MSAFLKPAFLMNHPGSSSSDRVRKQKRINNPAIDRKAVVFSRQLTVCRKAGRVKMKTHSEATNRVASVEVMTSKLAGDHETVASG